MMTIGFSLCPAPLRALPYTRLNTILRSAETTRKMNGSLEVPTARNTADSRVFEYETDKAREVYCKLDVLFYRNFLRIATMSMKTGTGRIPGSVIMILRIKEKIRKVWTLLESIPLSPAPKYCDITTLSPVENPPSNPISMLIIELTVPTAEKLFFSTYQVSNLYKAAETLPEEYLQREFQEKRINTPFSSYRVYLYYRMP